MFVGYISFFWGGGIFQALGPFGFVIFLLFYLCWLVFTLEI